jgi:hypothetical protein
LITDLATLASLADEIAVGDHLHRDGRRPRAGVRVRRAPPRCSDLALALRHRADGWRGRRVTERTWDQRPRWFKKPTGLTTGVPDRTAANAANIKATLDRLKEKAES